MASFRFLLHLPPLSAEALSRVSLQRSIFFLRERKGESSHSPSDPPSLSLGCANSCAFSFTPRIPTVLAFAGPSPQVPCSVCIFIFSQYPKAPDPDLASSNQPAQLDHICLTKCTFCISMTSVHIFIHSQYPRAQGRGAANQPAPACLWSAPPWSGSPAPHTPPRTLPRFPAAAPAAART